jgi:hypothetical protein
VEDDLGLVELLLDAHDGVGLLRVLVLGQVGGQRGKVDRGIGLGGCVAPRGRGGGGPLGDGDGGRVLVEDLVEEGEGDAGRVVLVGDDDARQVVRRYLGVDVGEAGARYRKSYHTSEEAN